MDFLKTVVVLAFLIMAANIVKPFVTSTRLRAGTFAGFWLILYILVWGIPTFVSPSPDEASVVGNEKVTERQQNDDEVPVEEKEEEAQLEEAIDFEPSTIELIIDASELLGLSREEFLSKFPKSIEPDRKDPMKMTFENGEVTFKDNVAMSITYAPEALHYPEDNRLLLASMGFEVEDLRKGSNPFETPVTIYLIDGFSDVTIYGEKDVGADQLIDRIYLRKEFYPSTTKPRDEETQVEE